MANRYDNGSVAKFDPFSYQELAVTPMMMRQKHDASIAQADALRIQANPLDVHLNRVTELKNQMDNEISKNVDTLNKEGYNPTTFQNIQRLNRQYQDMVSPTGEIGQINAAKTIYDTNQEEFIKDAAKQNIGRDQAIKKWQEKTAYYTGFGDDGKSITNVSPQGVAAYQDYTKDKQVTHSLIGKTIQGISSQGHHLEPDRINGGFWEVTRNGKRVKNDNTRQVEFALKSTLDKWDNPNGEGKKWLMDSGEGLNRDRIINDFNSMLETSDINDTSETANYNKPDPISDGSGDPPSGDGVIIANESKIEGSSKYDNYSQPHEEIKRISKLAAEGKAMLSDIQKRDELIELHRDADSKLSQMPEYKNLQSKFLQKQNEIKKYQDKYFTNKDGRLHRNVNASGHFVEINLNKLKNELNTISEKRSKIKNDAWNKSSKVINTYDYIPTTVAEGNAVQESFYGVGNVLSNTNNIGQLLDISEIYDTNSGKFSNITSNHRDTLTKVLNTADPKSFTISKPTPSGANGKPQVTITFTPKKGSSKYEIDNMEGWDKSIGGEDGTISFVATLKSKKGSKHASEISSLSNFITSRYEGKGENIISGAGAGLPQGTHLSQSMDYNTYRGYDMNEMYNEAFIENRSNNTVQIRDKVAYKILAGKASSKDMTIPQYIAKYGKEKI